MDKAYVSDFTKFMDQFLQKHPAVVEEQHRGWAEFWDLTIAFPLSNFSKEDIVRDEHYGFF